MADRGGRRWRGASWVPLLIIVVGVVGYHNSLHGPFIFDDVDAITENPNIRRIWPLWEAMGAPPEKPVSGRPVVSLSFAINYAVGGMDVWGYHVVNLAIHVLSALLLLGIVQRTLCGETLRERFGARAKGLGLAVALVWLVHPLATEAVDYITQRTELLMALFCLSTLYCVIRSADSARPHAWGMAAVAACALGMASKQVMVAAPLLVLLYDRTFLSGSFREALRRRWGLHGALAATWIILLALAPAGRRTQSVGFGFANITPWDYAVRQCGVILHYLRLSVWPHPLVLDYAWPAPASVSAIVIPAALLGVLLGGTVWALHRRPPLGFLGAWFLLILAPTSSFLPIRTEIAAERRMYLPLQAVVVLAVLGTDYGVRRVGRRLGWGKSAGLRIEAALLCAAVTALGVLTVTRNEDYRSEIAIWRDTVTKAPDNIRARINLGDQLRTAGQLDLAVTQYSEALRLAPTFDMAHNNLAITLQMLGRNDEAIEHYGEAVRLNPRNAQAHNNLGMMLARRGRVDEAIDHYREAVRIQPRYAKAHYQLGAALAGQGRISEATSHLETAAGLGFEPAREMLATLRARQSKWHPQLRAGPDPASAV